MMIGIPLNLNGLTQADFKKQHPSNTIVHIKGFGSGMKDVYDKEILAMLNKFKVLVWDGDDYAADGFTKLVPMYLDANPTAVAVSFKF